ncbi:nuclear transport factor 2 family protein [Ornithinimicrobium cryptoxanthini]|uniref:Nuclear transport factor 2 family protein n=1 Tax=Ornithinimicrobium cryptoxanthini TaxID=2934161 RepID=A0ABY4YPN5_9MICO|nr:nuclear transport factor 2 family protein [Ornithinimicrobium cryptoxanthini]USQ78102.1 nuclear transport factor 2 family protein [Ornithinimicrobium cryptoxanthini]
MDLVEVTHRYYRAVDAGDVQGVLDWFADDCVYHRPGYGPMHGQPAIAAFYGGERVIESGSHQLDQLLVDGASVSVRGVFTGRLKDGSQVQVGFADFIDYDGDGRARQRRSYFDTPTV